MVENATGSVCEQDIDYYPFGGVIADNCATVVQHYRFNGKEWDAESGLDNFGARYDASNMGRFMTPDWAAKPVSVPYANFGNPQSLNLYAYAENNPTTFGDPDGHQGPMGNGDYAQAGQVNFPCATNATDCQAQQAAANGNTAAATTSAAQQGQNSVNSQAQNACQSQSCNVKVISDTGPNGTPNPFPSPNGAEIVRDITYQAVDSKGNAVPNAEISLHEAPLPGKEGGDAANYNYAKGKGTSNSSPGDEANHRAGQFQDRLSQGSNGPAGFRQKYTVEGKPAKIIWRKDVPAADSQKVLIRTDKVVINPE